MDQTKKRLLIVEDEEAIREGLVDLFTFHGFNVDIAEDGKKGLELGLTSNYDAILLDVMLPEMNGFDVCNKLRESNRVMPIIMLTAKTNEEDIITGLSLGADDYISKPFSVRELVLRVQVILKRSNKQLVKKIKIDNILEINLDSLEGVNLTNQEKIQFSLREAKLLSFLFEKKDIPSTRQDLLKNVWGYSNADDIETRTVDIHIAKLRRKIETDPKNPRYITTIRGKGYRLEHSA